MTIKVCPNCGGERFEVSEHSIRIVILDGNRNHIGYSTPINIDRLSQVMKCVSCQRKYTEDDLITDAEFHDTISNKQFRDSDDPHVDDLSKEQRSLMWASELTLYEHTKEMYKVIKDRQKRFNGITSDDAEKSFESDTRTLIIYKDGTHRANFSK